MFSLAPEIKEKQSLFTDESRHMFTHDNSVLDLIKEAGIDVFSLINEQQERDAIPESERKQSHTFLPGSNALIQSLNSGRECCS